jgi:hypothetical protein
LFDFIGAFVIFEAPHSGEHLLKMRIEITLAFTENILERLVIAEALLELLESCEVVIYTWTFDCLRNFENATSFPVVWTCVLLNLISTSVVDKSNFSALNRQNVV